MEVIDVAAGYDRRGEAKKLFTKVFRLVRAEVSIRIIVYTVCSISLYVTVYIENMWFKNSTVYTFYIMYQKYTFL